MPHVLRADGTPTPPPPPKKRVPWAWILPVVGYLIAVAGAFLLGADAGLTVLLTALTLVMAQLGWPESRSKRVAFVALAFGMIGLIVWQSYTTWLRTGPAIAIKVSPQVGLYRSLVIRWRVWEFAAFLGRHGLNPPGRMPPIEVSGRRHGASIVRGGPSDKDLPVRLRESSLLLLDSKVTDTRALAGLYCAWAVEGHLPSAMSRLDKNRLADEAYLDEIFRANEVLRAFAGVACTYLVDSYLGGKSAQYGDWNNVLWDVRSELGRDFGDRLVAEMVLNLAEEYMSGKPEQGLVLGHEQEPDARKDLNLNLYRQIYRADLFIDSEAGSWPAIRAVLARRGIPQP